MTGLCNTFTGGVMAAADDCGAFSDWLCGRIIQLGGTLAGNTNSKLAGIPLHKLKTWGIAAVAIVGLYFFLFSSDGVWRTMVMKRRVAEKTAVVDSLAQMNRLMRGRIAALKAGDPRAVEEEARAHGMVKEGEKVYLLKEKLDEK